MPHSDSLPTIAVLGGTGAEGSGLALRWANAGYDVIIGSREAARAEDTATELNELLGRDTVRGMENAAAAQAAEMVVLSVPYKAHQPTLEGVKDAVQGKILLDVTVPLQPPKVRQVTLPEGRSAAEEAQAIVGEGVRVVSGFQNVSAVYLKDLDFPVECDVLVTGDDAEAKQLVIAMVEAIGTRGFDAGPLANAIVAESLTPVLLAINKNHKVKHAGIRISGVVE